MDAKLVENAIISDRNNTFEEVLDCVYSLEPYSKEEVVEIAKRTNRKLGFELFFELDYENLVRDFSIVARMMQINSVKSCLGGKYV